MWLALAGQEVWYQHKTVALKRKKKPGGCTVFFFWSCPACECELTCCSLSLGSARTVLKKKRCAMPSECGVTGKEYVAGLYFSHTSHCCDTNLCNAAARPSAPCWSLTALSLSSMALAVMLNPIWTLYTPIILFRGSTTAVKVQHCQKWNLPS